MKKLKFSIITVSIALSFGLFADENGSSLYNKAQTEALNKQDKTSAEQRTILRNKETLTGLKNNALEAEIEAINKQIELKRRLHILKNVPPEYLDDPEAYYDMMINQSKEVDITSLYPDIRENSGSFTQYPTETYDIDQRLAIPELKRQKQTRINDSNVQVISQDELPAIQQPVVNQIAEKPIFEVDPVPTEVDSVDIDSLSPETDDLKAAEDFNELTDILSPEELARLENIYNSDTDVIIDTQEGALKEENEKIEEESVFSTIESLSIDGVYIFGDNKSADLTLSFYVGDGVEGETFENQFREIKENQVISVKGFKYTIKNISFKEVEIEDEKGELYIASKSLRNIN